MKHITRNILLLLSCFTAMMQLCSCSEKPFGDETGTTDVVFRIGLSDGDLTVDDSPWSKAGDYVDATQYEKDLHSLRVIVSTGPKTIIYNEFLTESEFTVNTQDGQPDVVLEIPDVPYGRASFYVIANEESLWGSEYYTTDKILEALEVSTKLVYTEPEESPTDWHFPKTGRNIAQYGLPMSGSKVDVDIMKDMSPVEVKLERSVVKLSLTVTNSTASSITLQKVSFGDFFGNSFNMFREYNLDVPAGIRYEPFEFDAANIGVIAPKGTTQSLSLYLYPTHAYTSSTTVSPYTLGLETNVRTYPPQVFTKESYFIRNHQVSINAEITTTGLDVKFVVGPWDSWTVDVPSFD